MQVRRLILFVVSVSVGTYGFVAAGQAPVSPRRKAELPLAPKFELKVQGGRAELLKGREAGLALETLPGVKRISFAEWREMKDIPRSGLYLVDTDFVPFGLAAALEQERLVLGKDGSLRDAKGQPVVLFIKSETFAVSTDKGALAAPPGLLDRLTTLVVGTAEAANPYPFSLFSWSMWWRYRGGFCRDYRAWTRAEAWGPEQGGARPHTRIAYMETRAELGSRRDRDSCSNCDLESSYVRWNIGCFWPAHGGTSGWHYANWKDGAFSATRTWSWSH